MSKVDMINPELRLTFDAGNIKQLLTCKRNNFIQCFLTDRLE